MISIIQQIVFLFLSLVFLTALIDLSIIDNLVDIFLCRREKERRELLRREAKKEEAKKLALLENNRLVKFYAWVRSVYVRTSTYPLPRPASPPINNERPSRKNKNKSDMEHFPACVSATSTYVNEHPTTNTQHALVKSCEK